MLRIENLPSINTGISVVTTTWNERETIEELIQRTRTALKQYPHEIIVIDDSSQDETIEIAKRLADMARGFGLTHKIRLKMGLPL